MGGGDMTVYNRPEPEVLRLISFGDHRCGCELRLVAQCDHRWYLCQYHDGYNDALHNIVTKAKR